MLLHQMQTHILFIQAILDHRCVVATIKSPTTPSTKVHLSATTPTKSIMTALNSHNCVITPPTAWRNQQTKRRYTQTSSVKIVNLVCFLISVLILPSLPLWNSPMEVMGTAAQCSSSCTCLCCSSTLGIGKIVKLAHLIICDTYCV